MNSLELYPRRQLKPHVVGETRIASQRLSQSTNDRLFLCFTVSRYDYVPSHQMNRLRVKRQGASLEFHRETLSDGILVLRAAR